MALDVSTRLGPYAVTAAIRAGGMGEVYQARDTSSAGSHPYQAVSRINLG